MTFEEWAKAYGIESARKQFRLSDHLVFVLKPGSWVRGQCGNWIGSEPLGLGQSIMSAMERLRRGIGHSHDTEETIIA